MVSANRRDRITRREFPVREHAIRRDPLLHQRLQRDRQPHTRELYIDREEIPENIQIALDDGTNSPYNLLFAPLIRDATNRPEYILPDEPPESDTASNISDCSTIIVDLDDPTARIPVGLLLAFERNGEIPNPPGRIGRLAPSPPGSPLSLRTISYSPPNYSPVRPNEIDDILDYSPSPISPLPDDDNDSDADVNRILDYLESEEFLDAIVESNPTYT